MDHDVDFLTADTDDESALKCMFAENKAKLDSYITKISQAFESNDIQLARSLIAEIKYFINIEEKIKEKTYLH